jgi:hypothetical protein
MTDDAIGDFSVYTYTDENKDRDDLNAGHEGKKSFHLSPPVGLTGGFALGFDGADSSRSFIAGIPLTRRLFATASERLGNLRMSSLTSPLPWRPWLPVEAATVFQVAAKCPTSQNQQILLAVARLPPKRRHDSVPAR